MGNLVQYKKQAAFLAAFEETGNLSRAAEAAGCHRNSHYKWMEADPKYPELFAQSEVRAGHRLEEEARRRAVEGLKRYKFHQGEPISDPATGEPYFEHEYSDTLLIFLMKGAFPEKYRDRLEHRHDGQVNLQVSYDTQWYGRVAALSATAPDSGSNGSGEIQDSGVRKALGKNGNGTHRGD